MKREEEPTFILAHVEKLLIMLRAADMEKLEPEIVRTIIRQLPDMYDIEERSILAADDLTHNWVK